MNLCRFIVPREKDTTILPTVSRSLFSPLMFVVAQRVKNPPASAGDARDRGSIPGLGRSLKEEMANYSSILAWEIYGQGSLPGYSPWGCKELNTTEQLSIHTLANKNIHI